VEIRIDPSGRSDVGEERPRVENSSGREEGEILVRGPNVFSGYRSLPDKTKKAFTDDGWFRTGDLGRFDRQGWLYITGRVSTMIVTEGGENIQPENVEAAYERHSEIREIGVLQKDRKLVALVVPEPKGAGDPQETIQKALEEISRKLSSYQRISEFAITRDALPRTRLGKLERHRLKERFERAKSGQDKSRKTSGPMSIGEMSGEDRALLDDRATREVWELFARRFKDEHLTPDTSPQIDLGIDSLEWLDLTMDIRTRAGVELSEEAIGRIGTIRDLLREVTEASETESSAAPLDQPEEAMTESQKRWLEPRGPLMSLLARGLCVFNRLLMKVFFRVEAKGLEHLRGKEHFVLTPNHVSYLDPFAIAATLSYSELCRTHWGGWTAILTKNLLTRFVSRLGGAVPLDAERAVVSSLAFGAMVLQRQKNLVWFSEGRRSADGKLQPFKPGIGLLLRRFPAPVVPTFIEGAHDVLPPGKLFPRLKKITIVFGKPLDPRMLEREGSGEQPYHRIASALRDRVERLGREKAHQS
jgi:long-chain acyl-CoA synthetase